MQYDDGLARTSSLANSQCRGQLTRGRVEGEECRCDRSCRLTAPRSRGTSRLAALHLSRTKRSRPTQSAPGTRSADALRRVPAIRVLRGVA